MRIKDLLPWLERAICPCDANGVPAIGDEEVASAHFESKVVLASWFGRCLVFAYGDIEPRAVDPDNPRQYLPGDLS